MLQKNKTSETGQLKNNTTANLDHVESEIFQPYQSNHAYNLQFITQLSEENLDQTVNHNFFEKLLRVEDSPLLSFSLPLFKESQLIFCEKKTFQEKKVTNQPKHYFRKFTHHYKKFLWKEGYTEEEMKKLKKIVHTLNYKASNETKKVTMKDLMKLLLPGSIISEHIASKNRKIFHHILKADKCENSKKHNRLLHMIASRIYSLRCRSSELVQRNTIH